MLSSSHASRCVLVVVLGVMLLLGSACNEFDDEKSGYIGGESSNANGGNNTATDTGNNDTDSTGSPDTDAQGDFAGDVPPERPFVLTMALIPMGTFTMGSPGSEAGRGDNETSHDVQMRSFYIQTTEVTQAQWTAVRGSNPSSFGSCDECPVEMVSWYESVAFANEVSRLWGVEHCYEGGGGAAFDFDDAAAEVVPSWRRELDCEGVRLPTEAEWERAARGGTDMPYFNGYSYTDLERVGWFRSNARDKTHPVQQKEGNDFGLYDVHGNVEEWVWDWYSDSYGTSGVTDPTGPSGGDRRVRRGGSWSDSADDCRAAHRMGNSPYLQRDRFGLRLASSRNPNQ